MKILKVQGNPYICYICGKPYNDIKQWERCENSHQQSIFEPVQKYLPGVKSLTVDPVELLQTKDKSNNYNLFLPEKFGGDRQLNLTEE